MPSDTPKEAKLQIQSKKDEEPPRSILTKGPSSPPPTLNQDSNIVLHNQNILQIPHLHKFSRRHNHHQHLPINQQLSSYHHNYQSHWKIVRL